MKKWSIMDKAIAASSHKLYQGGITIKDWFSDKLKKKKMHKIFWNLTNHVQSYNSELKYMFGIFIFLINLMIC